MSPAKLARLEANQRGLYLVDFVRIVDALLEKPGNLLPNDLGDIGHLKPLIDLLASVRPALLPRVASIIEQVVLLTEGVAAAPPIPSQNRNRMSRPGPSPAKKRKARR